MTAPIVIFDIDDTLADTDHRQYILDLPASHIPAHVSAFEYMESLCSFDPPIVAMVEKCKEHISQGHDVRFWSGRGMRQMAVTQRWLAHYLEQPLDYFSGERLCMRPVEDRTKNHELKMRFFKRLTPDETKRIIFFYDDVQENLDLWNRLGYVNATILVKK